MAYTHQLARNFNLMLTETAILKPTSSTRRASSSSVTGESLGNLTPRIDVAGAFVAGGNQVGQSFNRNTHFELQNYTSVARNRHTIRFGVRARRMANIVDSPSGFGGTFSFFGGVGPVLGPDNQPLDQTEQSRRSSNTAALCCSSN